MSLTNCCSPCPTVQTVNTPGAQGAAGTDGADGADGINAFTDITQDETVPAAQGDSDTYVVSESSWMVIGQIVVIGDPDLALANPGPAHFRVTAIPSATSVTLEWLDYPNDVAGGSTLSDGCQVSPSGEMPVLTTYEGHGTGAAYTMTASTAFINTGTGDPTVTLVGAGTYLLMAYARLDYVGATYAANQNAIFKLRETNVGADIADATVTFQMAVITTLSYTAGIIALPPVIYTAAAGDIIQLWGYVSALPAAGTVTVPSASVVAIKIA